MSDQTSFGFSTRLECHDFSAGRIERIENPVLKKIVASVVGAGANFCPCDGEFGDFGDFPDE